MDGPGIACPRSPVRLSVVTAGLLVGLATPALAREARVLRLRFPGIEVPAGGNIEACAFVRLSRTTPFDLGRWEMKTRGRGITTLHAIVYLYRGARADEFPADPVASRGCLDLGPPDRDQRQMIAAISTPSGRGTLPAGVALRLAPVTSAPGGVPDVLGVLLDMNWQNAGTRPRRASARVLLRRAAKGTVRRIAQPLSDRTAELGLNVPPDQTGSTETSTAALNAARPGEPPVRDAWMPPVDACVFTLAPQMHKRARFFGADLVGADGMVRNPPGGTQNPFEPGRTHLYAALDYTDPGLRTFAPALFVGAGESIHYHCRHDNGVARAGRFGCEETAGTPPGVPLGLPGGHAAKPCASPLDCPPNDPTFPGRSFTGACVPANLVAGTTPDDEVCRVTGVWYDAAPGATSDLACDVRGLPVLE